MKDHISRVVSEIEKKRLKEFDIKVNLINEQNRVTGVAVLSDGTILTSGFNEFKEFKIVSGDIEMIKDNTQLKDFCFDYFAILPDGSIVGASKGSRVFTILRKNKKESSYSQTEKVDFGVTWKMICGLGVLPDGAIVTGVEDGTLGIWSKSKGTKGSYNKDKTFLHGQDVKSIAVLPDGSISSLGSDGTVKIWSKDTKGNYNQDLIKTFFLGQNVKNIAVLPDGSISSLESDGTVKIWSKDTKGNYNQEPIKTFFLGQDVESIAASRRDGSILTILSLGPYGILKIWRICYELNFSLEEKKHFLEALSKNTSLEKLSLADFEFDQQDQIDKLCTFILENKALSVLDLSMIRVKEGLTFDKVISVFVDREVKADIKQKLVINWPSNTVLYKYIPSGSPVWQVLNDKKSQNNFDKISKAFSNSEFLVNRSFQHTQAPKEVNTVRDKNQPLADVLELDYSYTNKEDSVHSPAAYFYDLLRVTLAHVQVKDFSKSIYARRPDLFEIPLDGKHTSTTWPQVSIINYILSRHLVNTLKKPVDTQKPSYQKLLTNYQSEAFDKIKKERNNSIFRPPFNVNHETLLAYLPHLKTSQHEILQQFASLQSNDEVSNQALALAYLEISSEEAKILVNPDNITLDGIAKYSDTKEFCKLTHISYQKLGELLGYEKDNSTEKQLLKKLGNFRYIDGEVKNGNGLQLKLDRSKGVETIENLTQERLKRIGIFNFISKKCGWTFSQLELIFAALNITEAKLTDTQLQSLAAIKQLQDEGKFTLPVIAILFSKKDAPHTQKLFEYHLQQIGIKSPETKAWLNTENEKGWKKTPKYLQNILVPQLIEEEYAETMQGLMYISRITRLSLNDLSVLASLNVTAIFSPEKSGS